MAHSEGLYNIPKELSFEGNVSSNWEKFLTSFIVYRKAALKKKDPDEVVQLF